MQPGLLERYKQDESQTLQYLLTRLTLKLNGGDLLEITDEDGRTNTWMVYWLEYIESSGYNRYVVIKMNYALHWIHNLGKHDEKSYDSLCYLFGKKKARLYDDAVERGSLYFEDTNTFNLVMPFTPNIFKEDYFEITKDGRVYPFRISGYDVVSTPGVVFVTSIPIYEHNKDPEPMPDATIGENSSDINFSWFTGDFKEK